MFILSTLILPRGTKTTTQCVTKTIISGTHIFPLHEPLQRVRIIEKFAQGSQIIFQPIDKLHLPRKIKLILLIGYYFSLLKIHTQSIISCIFRSSCHKIPPILSRILLTITTSPDLPILHSQIYSFKIRKQSGKCTTQMN